MFWNKVKYGIVSAVLMGTGGLFADDVIYTTELNEQSDSDSKKVEVHDYVIVGGGTGGLTAAYLLAKDGHDVVVLERGPDRDDNENLKFLDRIGFLRPQFYAEFFNVENGKPSQSFEVPAGSSNFVTPLDNQTLITGRVLGGTSSVNESAYWLPNQKVLNNYGGLFADAVYVDQVLKSMENFHGVTQALPRERGDKGPFDVYQGPVTTVGTKVANAVSTVYQNEYGISVPAVDDWNAVEGPAVSPRIQVWVDPVTNVRQSTSNALLKETNVNVDVRLNATVTQVVLKGSDNEARGVRYIENGKQKYMKARKKVILAAGSETSRLLKLSGVGDSRELTPLGLEVKVDNPHVGRNLFNDLQLIIPVVVPDADTAGILDNPNSKGVPFVAALPLPDDSDLQDRPFEILGIKFPFLPDTVLFVVFLNRVESRGYALLTNKDPLAPRIIKHNYLGGYIDPFDASNNDPSGGEADIDDLVQAARIIKKVAEEAGYSVPLPIDFSDDDAIRSFVIANQDHAAHWGGMASIGTVVDSDLHVIGTKKLMVADFSAAPEQMRGHSGSVAVLIGAVAYSSITGNTNVDFSDD